MSTVDDGLCHMHYFNRVSANEELSAVSSTPGHCRQISSKALNSVLPPPLNVLTKKVLEVVTNVQWVSA